MKQAQTAEPIETAADRIAFEMALSALTRARQALGTAARVRANTGRDPLPLRALALEVEGLYRRVEREARP